MVTTPFQRVQSEFHYRACPWRGSWANFILMPSCWWFKVRNIMLEQIYHVYLIILCLFCRLIKSRWRRIRPGQGRPTQVSSSLRTLQMHEGELKMLLKRWKASSVWGKRWKTSSVQRVASNRANYPQKDRMISKERSYKHFKAKWATKEWSDHKEASSNLWESKGTSFIKYIKDRGRSTEVSAKERLRGR